ncbi:uncharacterized protein LOC128383790 [Scomber scombrus]|uniref:Uncharacterized protein LOC128383790 n=1 Tax=Scomber scombrus TaxID=13677 RepID=A0AAV1PP26_SCOSC
MFYDEFNNNSRFTLKTENEVVEDTTLYIKGSGLNIQALVQPSASECIQHGGSVTLNCTVHTGTYYCAVASCGQILFGNGTKLDVGNEVDSLVLVYFLSGALAFTTILSVLLAFSMYKMKRNSFQSTESQTTFSAPSATNGEGHQDTDNLHYAALSVKLPNRSKRAKNKSNNECVYSSVK